MMYYLISIRKKVQIGNDQEMMQSEKKLPHHRYYDLMLMKPFLVHMLLIRMARALNQQTQTHLSSIIYWPPKSYRCVSN